MTTTTHIVSTPFFALAAEQPQLHQATEINIRDDVYYD
ncbi:hypothetical protein PMAG_a1804 [Pseudoalteromonas mariniglutinosa NCIMB 1770]|nr:hypothetical protein [Pseudoalteromonas mariniglutinosa NCIMB 1770]